MRAVVVWLGLMTACEPFEGSGERLPPMRAPERRTAAEVLDAATVKPAEPAQVPAAPASPAPPGPAGATAQAPASPPSDAASEAALLAEALGLDGAGVPGSAPPPPVGPGAAGPGTASPPGADDLPLPGPPPAPVGEASRPRWTPGTALEGSWGVRVLSITARSNPPRAILGLADGTERVVQPGAMLESERLVVMAIGEEAVQVSRIVPDGDRVRIESQVLPAFYRTSAAVP